MIPPPLLLSDPPAYTTPFCDDPWPGEEGYAEDDSEEHDSSGRSCKLGGRFSASSSRTSSSGSHVLPESAFMGRDGRLLFDPYFGKADISRLCSNYITKSFNCPEETSTSRALGQPRLPVFIAQTIYLASAPQNAVIATLILLQRFRAKFTPQAPPSGLSAHMLWVSALVIACTSESMQGQVKNARSAAFWSEMTLFGEREVDEMYRELWDELDGNVIVFPSFASALEKFKNPIPRSPSSSSFVWPEERSWAFDGDADDDDSVVDVELSTSEKQSTTKSTQDPKSSSFLRTRLASFFKKKA